MQTDFTIRAGLPFARRIRVVDGKSIWANLGDFEVRSQLRVASSVSSTLIADLHPFMTKAYGTGEEANDILIGWSMTGAQTRAIDANGYYDLVLSDPGATDARAVEVLAGQIRFLNVTTSGGDEA